MANSIFMPNTYMDKFLVLQSISIVRKIRRSRKSQEGGEQHSEHGQQPQVVVVIPASFLSKRSATCFVPTCVHCIAGPGNSFRGRARARKQRNATQRNVQTVALKSKPKCTLNVDSSKWFAYVPK